MAELAAVALEQAASLPPVFFDREIVPTSRALKQAFSYWNELRGDRPMPARAELDPRAMRAFLPNVALIEIRRSAAGVDYFVRLAGMRIEEVFGQRTGRMLCADLPPSIAARWRAPCNMVVESGKPIRTIGRLAFENKTWLEAETVLMPLGHDDEPTMILLAFQTVGGRAPPRMLNGQL